MLPKPIYEIIPLLYIATGIMVIISTADSILAISSGAILASSGITILFIRYQRRHSYCKLAKTIPQKRLSLFG